MAVQEIMRMLNKIDSKFALSTVKAEMNHFNRVLGTVILHICFAIKQDQVFNYIKKYPYDIMTLAVTGSWI
jgi:hypothetical protein